MNVADAEKNFAKLVNKVYVEGISIDLERNGQVIARLTPAEPRSLLSVGPSGAETRGPAVPCAQCPPHSLSRRRMRRPRAVIEPPQSQLTNKPESRKSPTYFITCDAAEQT